MDIVLNIKRLSLGPLGTNCYILYNGEDALIVDPGGDAKQIISFLDQQNVKPLCILLTHAHFDHIGGVEELRNHYNIDVYLHENEQEWLSNPELNRSLFFTGEGFAIKGPDHLLRPGKIELGSFEFEIIHTPGHSPGSVSFIFKDDQFIVSGDVLFQNGVGRSDLPGGNFTQLESTIREKLYKLPDEYVVLPGHGETTTIGYEKETNPFVSE